MDPQPYRWSESSRSLGTSKLTPIKRHPQSPRILPFAPMHPFRSHGNQSSASHGNQIPLVPSSALPHPEMPSGMEWDAGLPRPLGLAHSHPALPRPAALQEGQGSHLHEARETQEEAGHQVSAGGAGQG